MSLNIVPLRTVAVNVPITDINAPREYAILKGGEDVNYKQYVSTSYSQNSAQFSCPPSSQDVLVDRKVYLRQPITVRLDGEVTNAVTTILNSGYDAPRAYPLSTCMNTMQATINNSSVSINLSDVVQPLLRYNNPECIRDRDYSLTPSEMDSTQAYSSTAATIRNPLGNYGDSVFGGATHRGAFPYDLIVNNATTAILSFTACEPLFLSPYNFGGEDKSGFYGVRTMDFNFTWNQDLSRIWCHNPVVGTAGRSDLTAITVTFGQPSLLFQYTTPLLTMYKPISVSYPLFTVNRFPTGPIAINAGAIVNGIMSNNIHLNSIPRRMYFVLKEQDSDLSFANDGYTKTDTFASIVNFNMQFENRSGLFASASQQDLYKIAIGNGCDMSWTEWSGGPVLSPALAAYGTTGSVLCIEPGKDFGLPDNLAPGIVGNFMMQVNITAKNPSARNINYTLFIITVDEGTMTIQNGATILQGQGVINTSDVLFAKKQPGISYEDAVTVQGAGNILSNLRTNFGHFKNAVEPFVKPVVDAYCKSRQGGVLVGGSRGGVSVGGAQMSRSALKNRLFD